ncbi:MAG: hypothetical protein AAF191_09590, partial [Verrucomicrobiota bacterium]
MANALGALETPLHRLSNEDLLERALGELEATTSRLRMELRGQRTSERLLEQTIEWAEEIERFTTNDPVSLDRRIADERDAEDWTRVQEAQEKLDAADDQMAQMGRYQQALEAVMDAQSQVMNQLDRVRTTASDHLRKLSGLEGTYFEMEMRLEDKSMLEEELPQILKNLDLPAEAQALQDAVDRAVQKAILIREGQVTYEAISAKVQSRLAEAEAAGEEAKQTLAYERKREELVKEYADLAPSLLRESFEELRGEQTWLEWAYRNSLREWEAAIAKTGDSREALKAVTPQQGDNGDGLLGGPNEEAIRARLSDYE